MVDTPLQDDIAGDDLRGWPLEIEFEDAVIKPAHRNTPSFELSKKQFLLNPDPGEEDTDCQWVCHPHLPVRRAPAGRPWRPHLAAIHRIVVRSLSGVLDAALAILSGDRRSRTGPGQGVRRTRSAKTALREIVMDQVLQIIGAIMVLSGFTLAQFRVLDQRSYTYLVLNFAGSAILAVLAYAGKEWGFLLLEGVWALVSLWGLGVRSRGDAPAPTH